jgi:hypothetical protein
MTVNQFGLMQNKNPTRFRRVGQYDDQRIIFIIEILFVP